MINKDKQSLTEVSSVVQEATVQGSKFPAQTLSGWEEDRDNQISMKEIILQIKDWLGYLLPKWPFILVFGLIGGGIGYATGYFKKPIYKAELSFALEDGKGAGGGIGGAMGIASQLGFDLGGSGGGAFVGDNLLELMKSRSMVEKTLLSPININGEQITLAELYISYNNLREGWKINPQLKDIQFLPGADRSKFTIKQDSILGAFHKSLIRSAVSLNKLDKNLSIIIVKVNSENELFSKYFAEMLVKEVSDFYIETRTKKSVQNVSILQFQTDSVRRALSSAIRGVATLMDVNPNPNLARQILTAPSQNRQVDVLANQSILTELVKNLEVSKVSLRNETPLIQIIDKPILPLQRQDFSKIKPLIIGGFLGGMIAIFIWVLKKIFEDIMA